MVNILVRGIDISTKNKLAVLAKQNNFPSINAYLVHVLEEVVAQNGLLFLEKKVTERHQKLAEVINKNSDVMLKTINFLKEAGNRNE